MFVKFLPPYHFRLSNSKTDESCADRAGKGLFTKPPIHWQMKPLEYLGPDLFNLTNKACPDNAVKRYTANSFYLLCIVFVYHKEPLGLGQKTQRYPVLQENGNPYNDPMTKGMLF